MRPKTKTNPQGAGAPLGNRNASKRPDESILEQYRQQLGTLSMEQIAEKLNVDRSTAYKWFRK